MSKHRIAWQSRHTGFVGHGEWMPISKDAAEAIAMNANNGDKMYHHWVEAEDAQSPQATVEQKS